MTSRKQATQLDSEDKEKGGEPKGKIIVRRSNRNSRNQSAKKHFSRSDVISLQSLNTPYKLCNIKYRITLCITVNLLLLNAIESSKTNMVSTRKERQSSKRLLSQLDDFDRDMIIGNAAKESQGNVVVNEGTNDQDFTVGTSNVSSIINENAMNVKTLERCFNEGIDSEMSNIVDTVEDRLQNAILAAIDNIVAPKIELAIRSIVATSGQDVTSASATSERREYIGSNVLFENASENNITLGVTNVNDETRHNIPDEVSELSVPETHFDRQAHTHHIYLYCILFRHKRQPAISIQRKYNV